ncbi:DUF2130 domain-containing protein [Mycoplasma sp. Z407A]|uniref:DUF2130 domain-containing protein n=1 Tax=Mycoplasma sp. Z407A TaxID=3401678 RepID=UPI003AB0F88C
MSKKIGIKIKDFDKLEIELLQQASAGDFVSLLDLDSDKISTLFEKYKEQSTTFVAKIKEQVIQDYEKDLPNQLQVRKLLDKVQTEFNEKLQEEIKQAQEIKDKLAAKSQEYEIAKAKLDQYNETMRVEIENAQNKAKEQLAQDMETLKKKINDLNNQISKASYEKENEINGYKAQIDSLKKNHDLIVQNKVLEQKENIKKDFEQMLEAKKNELLLAGKQEQKAIDEAILNEKVSYLTQQISTLQSEIAHTKEENNKLTSAKYMRSTKELGEDFEKSIFDSLNENFGFDNSIRFSKTTISKTKEGKNTTVKDEGTKPDFLIEFLNQDPGRDNEVIGKIIIEAKDQASEEGKQKNANFYKKLESDRNNYKADIAFLVTTLEPNESYLVKNVNGYKNIVQMRFEALPQMIRIWQRLALEKSKLNRLDINLESKAKLLQKFDEFRHELMTYNVRLVDETIAKMIKQTDDLISIANNLRNSIDNELKGRFERLMSKFNKFSLQKEYEKLDIQDSEDDTLQIPHTMKEIPNIQDADIVEEE